MADAERRSGRSTTGGATRSQPFLSNRASGSRADLGRHDRDRRSPNEAGARHHALVAVEALTSAPAAGATAPAGAPATVAAACGVACSAAPEKRPTDATRHRSNNRRGSVGALLASAETTGTPGRQVVPAQRQALVLRGDGAALGRGRNARSRTPVPQGDRLDPAAAARDRDRTPTPPSPAQPPTDPGGRDRSHCVTITPGPSSPKFHDGRGNLRAGAPLLCSRREVI